MIDQTKVYENYIRNDVPSRIFCPEQALSQLLSEENWYDKQIGIHWLGRKV